MIRIDLAVITKEVMSLCLQVMNYGSEFEIMVSGPGVSVCNSSHDAITWRAESRTHLPNQTEVSLLLSSRRRGKGDSELRTKGGRRKKKPYVPLYTQSNYITIAS